MGKESLPKPDRGFTPRRLCQVGDLHRLRLCQPLRFIVAALVIVGNTPVEDLIVVGGITRINDWTPGKHRPADAEGGRRIIAINGAHGVVALMGHKNQRTNQDAGSAFDLAKIHRILDRQGNVACAGVNDRLATSNRQHPVIRWIGVQPAITGISP